MSDLMSPALCHQCGCSPLLCERCNPRRSEMQALRDISATRDIPLRKLNTDNVVVLNNYRFLVRGGHTL